jgi:hypothetical protein
MSRSLRTIATCILLTSCAATRAQATAAPREEMQKLYVDYLKGEGYSPEVNSDGNVSFKYEGMKYLILIDPKDRAFYQLALPGFWKIDGDDQRQKALAAANQAMLSTKVAKVLVFKTAVSASFELLTKDPADFSATFRRGLSSIQLAAKKFSDEMTKK